MNRTIDRLKLFFLIAFAVLTAAMLVYQYVWVEPSKRCEAQRNWWDSATRTCGKVIYIPAITGRPVGAAARPAGATTSAAGQAR